MDEQIPSNIQQSPELPPHKNWFVAHWILGVVFLAAVAAAAVAGIYYWQTVRQIPATVQLPVHKEKVSGFKLTNFAFTAPPGTDYEQKDSFTNIPGLVKSGHDISFDDKNKLYPSFDAITTDFSAPDVVPHDLLNGTLDSKDSFKVAWFDQAPLITEPEPGMYFYTAYGNSECSPDTESFLFVKTPQNSGLKYIYFSLGVDNVTYSKSDYVNNDPCDPNEKVIKKAVQDLANSQQVKETLQKALTLAKTFKFTDSSSVNSGTGTLTGHVNVGPICPVEREGVPCPVPPEAYTSRQVGVFGNSGLIMSKYFDVNGNYQFTLDSGTYTIKASGMRVDQLDTIAGTVTIKSGQTTTLDFNIDTGIR